MLDSFYRALFRPADGPVELEPGIVVAIWGILAVALALPAAGRLGMGGFGAFGVALVFFGALLATWFWTGAGLSLLARLAGGRGTMESTLGAVAQASWPLLLMPPALVLADARWLPGGQVFIVGLEIWVLVLGVAFVRRVHGLSWAKAVLAWVTLAAVSVLTSLMGLVAGTLAAAAFLG